MQSNHDGMQARRRPQAQRSSGDGRPTAADLAATREPFESARTLPAAFHGSDEVFQLEQAELFGRMWLCIGREADIAKAGDFITHEIGDERILVVRGSDATVRGFYALDGRLTQAPRMAADFAKGAFSLVQARLGLFWGFIFVNLDDRAEPLERYSECYHCPGVTMEGFDPIDVVEFWDVTNRQDWGLCERAQAGALSRGYRPGPYQSTEDCVHTFDRWYADRLAPLL